MKFEDAIRDMRSRPIADFGVEMIKSPKAGRNMYVCPICKSGTGKNKTGACKYDPQTKRIMCYSDRRCFGDKGEDTPGALSRIWNLSLPEVLEKAGYQLDDDHHTAQAAPVVKREPVKPAPVLPDYTAKFQEWHEALLHSDKALRYLHERGLDDRTINHFNLGYAEKWVHPSNESKPHPYVEERIIIPRTPESYSARAMRADVEPRYKIIAQRLFNSSSFNNEDVRSGKMPIIVTEGEVDAMLLWQFGYENVIALGSTGNGDQFVEEAKEKNPEAVYILALDNDEPKEDGRRPGQDAQAKIEANLTAAKIACISSDTATLYGGKKDVGEAALADEENLCRRLTDYCEAGYNLRVRREQEAAQEAYNKSGAGMVDSFLQVIQQETYRPISSGLKPIDDALGGGFIRGSVIVLGAAPGLGKTALISQICENIARSTGEDILYLNLEMSREILLARSIARIANAGGKQIITVNEILRGYEWSDSGKRKVVMMAAEEYKETVAQHMVYNPGKHTRDLDALMSKIEEETRRIGHAPHVCLDYLQLVSGKKEEDTIDVIQRAMDALKQYANKNHVLVFVISANNRASMKTGESGLNSGRDSSNIEYGADVHLGLEYEAVSSKAVVGKDEETGQSRVKIVKGKSLDYLSAVKRRYGLISNKPEYEWTFDEQLIADEYKENCTKFVVRVNKNRYLESERIAKLSFDGASARFLPIDTKHEDPIPSGNIQTDEGMKEIDPDDLPFG